MPLGIITYRDIVHQKKVQHVLHFPMKHGIMIKDNKIELSPMGIVVLNGATTTDISGIPCVFYSSCLYEHDSRENTKRQEASEYPLGSIFYARRHNRT